MSGTKRVRLAPLKARRQPDTRGLPMTAALRVVETGMDKQKALDAALAQIDRAFGKGSAMKLGQREALEIEAVSSGSLGLDLALGIGGFPRGRIRSEEHTSELQSLMRISYAVFCLKK